MIKIYIYYKDIEVCIQDTNNNKMGNIFKRFYNRIEKNDAHSLEYLYNGNIVNEELTFEQLANYEDRRTNQMKLIAYVPQILEEKNKIKKSNQIICPTCGELAQIKLKNYKISIYGCKNNHKIDDLNINEFETSQLIDESKIICDICKEKNKAETMNNQFYICKTCNLISCPLCKYSHFKTHNIIDYDTKFFICDIHNEIYGSYCKTCNKNLCILCEEDHDDHDFISYGKLFIKKNDLENKLKEFKLSIEKFKKDIEGIKAILQNVIDYFEKFYKLNDELVHNNYIKNRNYQALNNIKEFYNEDISKKLVNFTYTKNYFQKITQIFKLYNYLFKKEINIDAQSEEQEKLPNINEGIMKNSNEGEQLMTVIFISEDQKVHYSFICKKIDKFQDLESKLYKIYPEYSQTDNHFAVNGRTITKSKNLDDNGIKNSAIITLYCDKLKK